MKNFLNVFDDIFIVAAVACAAFAWLIGIAVAVYYCRP